MAAEPIKIGPDQERKLTELARRLGNGASPSDLANQAIDEYLQKKPANVDANSSSQPKKEFGFWDNPTIEEIIESQGVKPIRSIEDLAGDFWPEDEDPDEFTNWLREIRREG